MVMYACGVRRLGKQGVLMTQPQSIWLSDYDSSQELNSGRGGGSVMNGDATVFVVDDDAAARKSVATLVGLKGLTAKQFSSAGEFLDQYDPTQKGCVVVDVRTDG